MARPAASNRRPRSRRTRPSRWYKSMGSAGVVMLAIGLLFAMAWGANSAEQLRRERSHLTRQLSFEQDQLRRLTADYLQATSRHRIMTRAVDELGMVEASPSEKSVLALPGAEVAEERHPVWEKLASGLVRFGEIRGAQAEEERP